MVAGNHRRPGVKRDPPVPGRTHACGSGTVRVRWRAWARPASDSEESGFPGGNGRPGANAGAARKRERGEFVRSSSRVLAITGRIPGGARLRKQGAGHEAGELEGEARIRRNEGQVGHHDGERTRRRGLGVGRLNWRLHEDSVRADCGAGY